MGLLVLEQNPRQYNFFPESFLLPHCDDVALPHPGHLGQRRWHACAQEELLSTRNGLLQQLNNQSDFAAVSFLL